MRSAAKNPSQDKSSALILGHDGVPIRRILAPLVRRLQQVCLSMIAAALKEADLVQLEYALLVFVDDVPGISQQSLSEALGIDRNNVSLIADKLEARGLLKRAVNGADRRARELTITPEGRKLRRGSLKVRQANDRILTSLRADEKELFLDMLVRVVEGNRIHARPGGGRRKRGSVKPSVTQGRPVMPRKALFILASLFAVTISASQPVVAEAWPHRTVKIIAPLPAGGATDLAARLFAEGLSRRWGQSVIVENRPGADGIAGVTSFVNAHDDHTLLFSFAGPISINPLIHDKLPYDPVRDLVPIAAAIDNFFAIAVSRRPGVQSIDTFIAAARDAPERFNWAATAGLPQYIFLALQKRNGLTLTQVPYREFAPALQDLAENRIQVLVTAPAILMPAVASGKARLLMVTNRQRSPIAPEVPTAIEAGFPELTFDGVVGFFGGRDLPTAVRDRIADDVAAVGENSEVNARLQAAGVKVRVLTPAQFASAIDEQRTKVREIVSTNKTVR